MSVVRLKLVFALLFIRNVYSEARWAMNSKLFLLVGSRIGLAVALGMLGSFVVEAAEIASRANQLQAPTHRQVRLIEPKIDGRTLKLHTITG